MHTKEPWVVGKSKQFGVVHISVDETCEFAPRSLALMGIVGDMDEEESIANARRIVACVNACAGIPTELLEKDLISPNKAIIIKAERDELLAALKESKKFIGEMVSFGGRYEYINGTELVRDAYSELRKISEAIAKCEA